MATQQNPTHTPVPYTCPCSTSKKSRMFFRSHFGIFCPKVHFSIKFSKKLLHHCICVFHEKPTIPLIFLVALLSISVMLPLSCLLSKVIKLTFFNKSKSASSYPAIILLIIVMIKKKEIDCSFQGSFFWKDTSKTLEWLKSMKSSWSWKGWRWVFSANSSLMDLFIGGRGLEAWP